MDAPRPRNLKSYGFTLLEVLVALAIVAIALGALLKSTAQSVDTVAYLRDRTFAHWVGMNVLAEYRIRQTYPDTGTQQGTQNMAGRDWYWRLEIKNTQAEGLRRMVIAVYAQAEDKEALAVLHGFIDETGNTTQRDLNG